MKLLRTRFAHPLFHLLLAGALAACGGGGLDIGDLDEALVDALCDRGARCGAYTSEADCRDSLAGNLTQIEQAVQSGRASYDADKAEACIDALRATSCDRTAEDNRVDAAACDGAFRGTVADGGTCYQGVECVSGSCEVGDCNLACCVGVCDPTIAAAAIGQACPDGDCVDGGFCDEATATCLALKPAGQACAGDAECGYGLYCSAVCTEGPDRGQACPDEFCANLGDRCDPASTTCAGRGARGAACRASFVGLADCQQPLVCDEVSLTCQDRPAVGEACFIYCASGAFCNASDVCEAEHANGTACANDSQCASDYCDRSTAAPTCAPQPICG